MALHYIFVGFFLISFIFAVCRFLGYVFREYFFDSFNIVFDITDRDVFITIVNSTFDLAGVSATIAIGLIGIMTLWMGFMKIGEDGGAVRLMARAISPLMTKIFPELPKDHPAFGSMIMNFSANMLGLDNAATPLGLTAMKQLQSVNTSEDTASNSQLMFLVLNTSGLTIVPISVMAIKASMDSISPSDIFIPILLATYFSSLAGLITVSIVQKINLFNKTVMGYLGGMTLLIVALILGLNQLSPEALSTYSAIGGNAILFSIIISFFLLALRSKIDIYASFIKGAKEGFEVAIKIIPYLVAMLVAIGVFKACGAKDVMLSGLAYFFDVCGANTDFVPSLGVALMKPLSGSGARAEMVMVMNEFGVDSFQGSVAACLQGSTETTFYTLAVYFGAVGVTKTRYAVQCGLIADFVGITAAIFFAYLFFH